MTGAYLDHNATTSMRSEVRAHLLELLDLDLGNPSSLHGSGRRARAVLDDARERTAGALGVSEEDVVFTSGGTEANNLAVLGCLRALGSPGRIVTTAIEHAAVLEPARHLEREGHALDVAPVGSDGLPDPDDLVRRATLPDGALLAVHAANNEIGSCPDLATLGGRLREACDAAKVRVALHVDAVQALGRVEVDLRGWGADLAAFSAHKVGGPLGTGVLVRRGGLPLEPLTYGGGQEGGLRPGTENAAALSAAALAIELAVRERDTFATRLRTLEQELCTKLRAAFPSMRIVGPEPERLEARLPGTINVLIPGVEGRVLVTKLDLEGLAVSAGSACASGSLEPSHVLLALGLDANAARAGLRLSLGRETTSKNVHNAVDILRRSLG